MAKRTKGGAGGERVAVGYVRVSTDDQSIGLDAQRAGLDAWAAREGYRLAVVCEDFGVSGAAPLDRRPGLVAALDALAVHGACALVVLRRDRLARSAMNAALVESLAAREGARVLSADGVANGEGPEGDLLRGMLDLLSQYERALIRARTRAAMAVKKSRGEYTGGRAPFGWRVADDGTLAADAAEQCVILAAREYRAAGLSLRQIGARLAAGGILPRSGGQWTADAVATVCNARTAA